VPVCYPQRCSFLVPWHFNKFVYFYIGLNGGSGESGGHENTVKTHEIGGLYFHLKRGSRLGPTKLSRALPAEWGHRAACLQQVFGSYVQVLDRSKSKLGPNTHEGKYLGPAVDDVHFYWIWMTNTGKVIWTRDVTFLENDSTQPSSHFLLKEGQKSITKARIDSDTNSDSEDENCG